MKLMGILVGVGTLRKAPRHLGKDWMNEIYEESRLIRPQHFKHRMEYWWLEENPYHLEFSENSLAETDVKNTQ